MLVAQYIFNSSTDTLPTFNNGFNYTYTDVNNGNGTKTRTITSNTLPNSISFGDKTGLVSLSYLDTSNVTDMSYMFFDCYNLTSLDVSSFNTSKVTDMSYMFWGCSNLTILDLSNFDTSDVTNMKYMFYNCDMITSLDLSNFDTGKVTDMSYMFHSCNSLTTLDLSNFDTSDVTNMSSMFGSDWDKGSSLQTIDISNLNMENVTVNTNMFNNCYYLNKVILNDITTASKIIPHLPNKNEYDYVAGTLVCNDINPSLIDTTTLQSKNWNIVSGIKIAEYTFNSGTNTLPTFNSGYTYDYTDVDNGDGTITRTITSDSSPTNISFNGETGLVSVSYLDTSNVTTMYNMFANCSKLTTLDLSGWNTDNVTTIETMFAYCSSLLTVIGLNELNVSNVDNMGGLFTDCSNLTEINVSDWDVSKVTNFGAVFRRCPKLTNIDVSKWDTSSGVIMSGIFTNCSGLIEIDLSNWDMSHANSVSQMFYGCSALMKLKMCANLNQDTVTTYWFGKCNSLNDVQLSDFDIYTINKVINELPAKTANNQGSLIVPKIDDSINTSLADSKYWIVSLDPTNIRHIYLDGITISNLYIGEVGVKKIYLGEAIVYENKQVATDKDTLYNEFTGTLFILKEDALSYDEEELALNINSNIINVSYNEENLNIGGDK